ncbi:ABC transporter permease [Clostridia bacterium]|nr:ABC transporter permease [Clostridia bacterium]
MLLNILKKDLKRKKSMNIILLIFIVLCTIFLASSVNNLFTVSNSLNYFAQKAHASDYFILSDDNEISSWLEKNKEISDFDNDEYLIANTDIVKVKGKNLNSGNTISLTTIPNKYNIPLQDNGTPIKPLKAGEIAICYSDASLNDAQIGDRIKIAYKDKEKTLTISSIIKDQCFGSTYMGINRLFISSYDYDYFSASAEASKINFYSVITDDTAKFAKDFNKEPFRILSSWDKQMLNETFTMDLMVFSIMIICALCLIIISFVILRFTIVFTLSEDYKELGIMKAIGIKNFDIKRLYIVKYLFMAIIGAIIGVLLSIPFGDYMMSSAKNNMVIDSATDNFLINIICGLIIIFLVTLFCYFSAGKINKFTATQAIRNGSTGERYKGKSIYKLHRHQKTPAVLHMAINDIFSTIKTYAVLIITFILGTLLVIIPANAANTLASDDIINFFGTVKSDVYIDNTRGEAYVKKTDINYMLDDIKKLEETYKKGGVDIELYSEYTFNTTVYTSNPDDNISILGMQSQTEKDYILTVGTAPRKANEISMTKICQDKLGVTIGDTVNISIGNSTKKYIITASYESMNMMGESLRFASKADTDFKYTSGAFAIQGNFKERRNIDEQIEKLKKITPDYKIETTKDWIENVLGGIRDTMKSMKYSILVIVMFINCLITLLISKTFITKDIGEIALLKSIGFSNNSIKAWQALRIFIVMVISVVLGILLSVPGDIVMVKTTFGMMGAASVPVSIIPLEVYVLLPLILIVCTSIAAILSMQSVNKVNLKEINNIE